MNADNDPRQGSPKAASDLDALGDRLAKGRDAAGLSQATGPTRSDQAMGDGIRVAIEFVVSTLVGAGLGFFIGGLLGGAVLGLLIGLLLGFAAGLRGVYRGMMVGHEPAKNDGDSSPSNDGAAPRGDERR